LRRLAALVAVGVGLAIGFTTSSAAAQAPPTTAVVDDFVPVIKVSGLIDPIVGLQGTLEYDHNDGISITGGFVYRGTAIPELYGKYIFGDLALHGTPTRADGRLFYADLTEGLIKEFLLPDFANGVLPNGLTVHGFGQDGNGELYAMVTNSPANGTGGIVYLIVPEPGALGAVGAMLAAFARRRRVALP